MTPKPCFLTLASALHSRTCAPNFARRFAVKHPPYPTKPTTARALDGAHFEQARQILVRRFAFTNPPIPTKPTTGAPLNRARLEKGPQFLARQFAASNPPNPTKPTTEQEVDSARFEQARQFLVRRFAFANPPIPTKPTNAAGHCAQPFAFADAIKNQPKPTSASYTGAVTSKKGVIGFGDSIQSCDESRSYPAVPAALLSVPHFFGGSDGSPRGLPGSARIDRFANPFEPPPVFGDKGGGCSKPQSLEAIHG